MLQCLSECVLLSKTFDQLISLFEFSLTDFWKILGELGPIELAAKDLFELQKGQYSNESEELTDKQACLCYILHLYATGEDISLQIYVGDRILLLKVAAAKALQLGAEEKPAAESLDILTKVKLFRN